MKKINDRCPEMDTGTDEDCIDCNACIETKKTEDGN